MGVVALMYTCKIVPRSRYNWRFSSDVKAIEQIITRFDQAAHIPGFKKNTKTLAVQLQATFFHSNGVHLSLSGNDIFLLSLWSAVTIGVGVLTPSPWSLGTPLEAVLTP